MRNCEAGAAMKKAEGVINHMLEQPVTGRGKERDEEQQAVGQYEANYHDMGLPYFCGYQTHKIIIITSASFSWGWIRDLLLGVCLQSGLRPGGLPQLITLHSEARR